MKKKKQQIDAIRAFFVYARPVALPNQPENKLVAAFMRAIDKPGFQWMKRPKGRPRKLNIERDFPELLAHIERVEKNPRGRPSKGMPEQSLLWLTEIEERKKQLHSKFNRRVTDKEAIESMIREVATARGKSVTRALAKPKLLSNFQKRISDARRIRKSRGN